VVGALDPVVVGTVDDVLAAEPDTVVLAGPGDPSADLDALIAGGYPPAEHPVYLVGGDGQAGVTDRGGALEGMKALVPGTETAGSEIEDAVVLAALAAEAAGTDDPTRLALALPALTRDGETCTSFDDCRPLVAAGVDVVYDGPGGAFALDEAGDPTSAVVTVLTYAADDRVDPNRTEYLVANS
jgi:branched-chain amino acid transport system substrate-binding protein